MKSHAPPTGRLFGLGSTIASAFHLLIALVAFLGVSGTASAQMLSVAETEDLVRASYFEGMPQEAAARIGPAGAARLVVMLSDPAESASHAQIMLALGLCGSPDARSAILGWAAGLRERTSLARGTGRNSTPSRRDDNSSLEIDRDTFKAWQVLPYALGSLAKFDPSGIADLETWMRAESPGWTFRRFRGARLHDLARQSAAMSLAETGLPEARRALDRAGRNLSDPRFEAHLREARAHHTKRAGELTR